MAKSFKRTKRTKRGGMYSMKRSQTPRKSRMTFIESIQPYRVCDIANVGRKSKQQPETTCDVYHFDCNVPVHNELITRFTNIATKQRHFFYEIFPWKTKCKKNWQMFIALRTDPRTQNIVICAWCSVRYQDFPNPADGVMHKTAYIVEVSVRRKKAEGTVDENYRGMGIELLKKIIEYSRTQGVSMLYLVPSNEHVKRLYMSGDGLNMSEVPGTSYLVKSLSDAVTVPMMNGIIGLKRLTEIAEETRLFAEELSRLPDDIRKLFIEKTDAMELNLDDKIAILGEIAIMIEEDVREDEIIEYIDEL